MTFFTWAWLWWFVMFGVIEGAALMSNTEGRTLTGRIVSWASLKDKSGGWIARRASLVGFFGWLVYHFVSRTDF